MSGEFQWTESGLELLENIKSEINKSGGRISLMKEIMDENRSLFSGKEHTEARERFGKILHMREKRKLYPKSAKIWSDSDVQYVVENFGRMKTASIARIIQRTPTAVRCKFKEKATREQRDWVIENGLRSGMTKTYNMSTLQERRAIQAEKRAQEERSTVNRIIGKVGEFIGVTTDEIIGKSQSPLPTEARHIAMHLIFKKAGITKTAIGGYFHRDPTTVILTIQKVDGYLKVDKVFRKKYNSIEKEI